MPQIRMFNKSTYTSTRSALTVAAYAIAYAVNYAVPVVATPWFELGRRSSFGGYQTEYSLWSMLQGHFVEGALPGGTASPEAARAQPK